MFNHCWYLIYFPVDLACTLTGSPILFLGKRGPKVISVHLHDVKFVERKAFHILGIRLLVTQLENRTALIIVLIVTVAMLSIYSVVRLVGGNT